MRELFPSEIVPVAVLSRELKSVMARASSMDIRDLRFAPVLEIVSKPPTAVVSKPELAVDWDTILPEISALP